MSGPRERVTEGDVEQWEYDSLSETDSDSIFSSSATSSDSESAVPGVSGELLLSHTAYGLLVKPASNAIFGLQSLLDWKSGLVGR